MTEFVKIFIGGFGDSWVSGIVESYYEQYRHDNPGYVCQYYNFQQSVGIRNFLRSLPETARVTVVGHSWGGDTAFFAVQTVPRVDVLITIDPVGWMQASWTAVRPHCALWLNVRAEAESARRDFSDRIAAIGTKYPRPPAPGQAGAPNYAFSVNATHGEFYRMMRAAPAGGVSGQVLLGGNHVG